MTIHQVSAEESTGSINISVLNQRNDLMNIWGIDLLVYQDSKDHLYLDPITIPTNPFNLSDLPLGHTYFLQINRHDLFGNIVQVKLDKPAKNVPIIIRDVGGIQIQAYYKDLKPITGGIIKIYSDKGNKWGESQINDNGLSERFWLQVPILGSEHYVANITTPGDLVYTVPVIRPSAGFLTLQVITDWNSVVNRLIEVDLYKTQTTKIKKSDGNFIVELYDNKSNKIAESAVTIHGQAFFSNIEPGTHILRVLKLPKNNTEKPLEWSIKQVVITDKPIPINIFGYGSSDTSKSKTLTKTTETITRETKTLKIPETCNCVAFRLDNIQDGYLDTAQLELLNLFQKRNIPLTIGILGENFGNDTQLVDSIKQLLKNKLLEVGNNGKLIDITSLTKEQQLALIRESNGQINNVLGVTPSVFIPIYGNYNVDTLEVMKANNIHYISGVSSADIPPYDFHGLSVYRFPATTATGHVEPGNGWYGKTHKTVLADIEFSLNNYGFAVVLLNPHEYSIRTNWNFQNNVDLQQILELNQIIDTLQEKGVTIVPINEIRNHVQTNTKIISLN
jgi:peptidoglycan/xylan/chitin deacetylase (PgdA/CDA1 family)